ncbi:uncharacterized protein LOC100167890 isoform X2 [Acyrthosiphon pisum]|uniref:[histone H3]-lysine(36) N-trimethyltransferase n=1 Tax=Acyrthosiphon pisum TaxID=7029 RepID=A0A8R2NP47_ACYPI|nr:uncharacterized protein LOC100167890 isoform X2 [Acyrthosiphon pisum]
MDESCTEYDLMIHNNKQVEKPSNKRNSSSDIELIDENHSIIDSKSSLPTRKQRLIDYLTTTHTPDKNITSNYKLHNFSTVNLINFVPKIDDYNKPVKVKSQWTRTSQLELALENSTNKNTLPVNNLSKSEKINKIFTMDVSHANSIVNQINKHTDDTRKTDKKTDANSNCESHCYVVVDKFDDDSVPVKRKRGRPKKRSNNITDNTSVISKIGNQDPVKTNPIAAVEPKNTDQPKVIKRGRGRPRKNELTSTTIQIPPIVANSAPAKKRKRTKQGSTVLKKPRATTLNNDKINDSESPKLSPRQHAKLSSSEVIKSLTKKINENIPNSSERSLSPIMLFPGDGNDFKCITLSRFDDTVKSSQFTSEGCDTLIDQENTTPINFSEGCNNSNVQENTKTVNFLEECNNSNVQENTKSDNFLEEFDNSNVQIKTSVNFLEGCDNTNVQENSTRINILEGCDESNVHKKTTSINFLEECDKLNVQDKIDCVSGTRIKINEFLSESEQDVFSELEKVDWNLPPKRIRSNSVNKSTKIKYRRNSLTDNFVYNPPKKSKNSIFEDLKSLKSWKSVSYLERGPNVQTERIIKNELVKKFRSKLKRSRSFPNCLFLDTVIWRFLIQECEYECDSEENYESSSDLDADSNSDSDGCENSEPIQQYEQPEEKTNYMSGNLDNLNMMCSTNDLPSFQIPPNISDLENSDSDSEDHRGSDRYECHFLENSVSPNISELKNSESDQEESEGKIRRSKRLNTKFKASDMLEEEYLLSSENSKIDSLLLADEIRKDNEIHLAEARANDPELDKKLKKLNFTLITNNLFRPHRKKMGEYTPAEAQELRRLKPRIIINSDTYKCHCKYTRKDWIEKKPGCATECLNRLLNIECGKACVLKSLCTNKQFQNKQFKRTKIIKTADKGYGVFALEDIPSGTFVDEYMGEVIDQCEMIIRMKKILYKNNNYMVQLKHDEIIDATRKGNITRFINHSCEPNCVAEKWNVLGESRMGFFSKELIRKGEEITFDYSFEIFGDAAQQKCYCGTPKCRGFISKKSRTGDDQSSCSEDNDEHEDDNVSLIIKPDACLEKKKKAIKKISNKDRKRLRQLDQQLTDISKLKNKNRSDLESSTLNLNKLMVHITDSMSRSHILKFIRDNDLNCKRLFMNFNGLNIIHSWMTSNNNKRLKLEIVETLSDLPISNRNTITKSKVLDIVAQWANIPLNIKEIIENLEYPISQIKEHEQEIDKLLPDVKNISPLVKAARILWKKWIVLKIVFKIPKLDRPKEVNIPDDVIQPPILFSQTQTNSVPYHFGNPAVPNQLSKISCVQSQGNGQTNSVDSISKIINHQKINRDKNKTVLEWKKQCDHQPFKKNKVISPAMVNYSINSVLNPKQSLTSTFKTRIIHQDIPTIESSTLSKNIKWSDITENNLTVYELPTDSSEKINSANIEVIETEPIVYYPIEEIITTNQTWNLPPPTIVDLCNGSTLHSMLKTVPPCLPNDFISNTSDETSQCSFSYDTTTTWCVMRPENVMYDAQHPSIQEQLAFLPIDITLKKSTKTQLDNIPNTNVEKTESNKKYKVVQPLDEDMHKKYKVVQPLDEDMHKKYKGVQPLSEDMHKKYKVGQPLNEDKHKKYKGVQPLDEDMHKKYKVVEPLGEDKHKKYKVGQPLDEDMRKKLFKQCEENVQQLIDKGILNVCKTARQNYVDQSPIKILQSFFNKKLVKSTNVAPENKSNQHVLPNLIKRIKVISSCYRKQPSKIIEINNLVKSNSQISKNDIFRIKEDQKTEITDTTSVALMLQNEQLSTIPQTLNLNKMFNKKLLKLNTKNKFAFKILNGMIKHNSSMPKYFILQLPSDTKIITHNPSYELELHKKLIPSVQNILCAELKRGLDKGIIKVYKQKIVMKYDETKAPESVTLDSILKENIVLSGNSIEIPQVKKQFKRKMPLPPLHNTKNKKIRESRNQANDNTVFKKPMPPVINKNSFQRINTSVTNQVQEPKISSIALINTNANEFRQKPSTSRQNIPSTAFLKLDLNNFRSEPSTSSCLKPDIDPSKIKLNELSENPSNQLITNITSLKTNANEIRQKPLMKCLPFNKVDNILITELEQNAKLLASTLSMDSTYVLPSTEDNSELIDPIVQNFKNSICQKKSMIRANLVDDPIVRDYIERTQSKSVDTKRKCKLPESMMSLPIEVLNLIPDNQREIKYVIDFYHAMATVIVKVLDLYVKKSCKQGRIKNDDDFKYLAKKLNANILFKELQVKKVEDLRISDSVKQKVEQYIKKYMLKYGKLYRRKSTDQ